MNFSFLNVVLVQLIIFWQDGFAREISTITLIKNLTPIGISTTTNSVVNDLELVKKNINYVASAFCRPAVLTSWNCQACLRAEETINMRYVTVFGNVTGANGYVGVNKKEKSIYVAFRGMSSIFDLLSSANIIQSTYFRVPIFGALVHSGFNLDNLALAKQYTPIIEKLLTKSEYEDYSITFVGHSLGGALATLATIEIKYSQNIDWSRIKLFTYGSPRVGNIKFAQWFNKFPLYASRAVMYNDLVPHLPPIALTTWSHVQTEHWVDANNNTLVCDRSKLEDVNCSDSIPYFETSRAQHLHYFNVNLKESATTNC